MMGPENISLHDKKQIRKHIQYWAEVEEKQKTEQRMLLWHCLNLWFACALNYTDSAGFLISKG